MCRTSLLHCTVKAKNAVVWHSDCKTVCPLNCTSQRHCSLVTLSKWTKPALYKPKTLQPVYQSNKKGSYHFLPFLYFWGLQEGYHIFFCFKNKHHVFCWQKIICVTKTQLQWNAFCFFLSAKQLYTEIRAPAVNTALQQPNSWRRSTHILANCIAQPDSDTATISLTHNGLDQLFGGGAAIILGWCGWRVS